MRRRQGIIQTSRLYILDRPVLKYCRAVQSNPSAGLASTPAMFMSTIFEEYQCDGAVMVTASHLPWNRNGMKFFSKEGGLNKGDIADIVLRIRCMVWKMSVRFKELTGRNVRTQWR